MKTINLAVCIFILIIAFPSVAAVPPIAAEFYGNLFVNGEGVEINTPIIIQDSEGVVCGSSLTAVKGSYGLISCKGDDPSTENDEGALGGEKITFYVNGLKADSFEWKEGQLTHANITVSKPLIKLDAATSLNLFGLLLVVAALIFFISLYTKQRLRYEN